MVRLLQQSGQDQETKRGMAQRLAFFDEELVLDDVCRSSRNGSPAPSLAWTAALESTGTRPVSVC